MAIAAAAQEALQQPAVERLLPDMIGDRLLQHHQLVVVRGDDAQRHAAHLVGRLFTDRKSTRLNSSH